jgi:carotenoid cleavage dioxygenase-like enzyme
MGLIPAGGPPRWCHLRHQSLCEQVALGMLPDAMGTGNTALAYHAGQLLALHEGDAPYVLRANSADGTLDTLGEPVDAASAPVRLFSSYEPASDE